MTIVTLLHHYFEYLRSPPVLLSILVVVGPISLELFKNYKLAPVSAAENVPGCFRLGISKRSNLDDQYVRPTGDNSEAKPPRIKALFTYPVKSCKGVELAASEVGATGLKFDRLFTFAQLLSKPTKAQVGQGQDHDDDRVEDSKHEWRFITQREFPRLALIETELWVPKPQAKKTSAPTSRSKASKNATNGLAGGDADGKSGREGCLIIRFPSQPKFNFMGMRDGVISIYLPLNPSVKHMEDKGYSLEPLSIWTDLAQAVNVTGEMQSDDLSMLASFLGVRNPLGLFRVDPTHRRRITRSLPKDRPNESYSVGFADAFPFHVLSLASVRAQEDEMPDKSALKSKLDARRFRANVYISGPPAYDEDGWKKVTMGRCIKGRGERPANGNAHPRSGGAQRKELVEAEGEYHVACRTARCKLPNVDQDTAEKDANEPLSTLRKTRQVDKGAYPHPCLGMQMIPLFQQGILRVGDEVRVLERGEHVYEKMFQ